MRIRSCLLTIIALAPALPAMTGCGTAHQSGPVQDAAPKPNATAITVAKPKHETLHLKVSQPGQMQAFEHTPIYPKITGFVVKWNVDIGAHVSEGQVLAELYVPEMVKELKLKAATVTQFRKAFEVAKGRTATAASIVEEVKAGLNRAKANHERWRREHDRISKLAGTVIDSQVKDETWNQLQSATAGEEEAKAKIATAAASWDEAKAAQDKAQVDIAVADADRERLAALVDYATLRAALRGRRDPAQHQHRRFRAASHRRQRRAPLCHREARRDAHLCSRSRKRCRLGGNGLKAKINVQALQGQELAGDVVRTSQSLDPTTRTLLTEIDLPNTHGRLQSGMYVHVTIMAEQPGLTVPAAAVITQGDVTQGYQSFCFMEKDGKARRVQIELGVRQGSRVQVLRKQVVAANASEAAAWQDFSGEEKVIQENASSLADGQTMSDAPKQ